MGLKDGKPCRKCGANDWYKSGRCRPCRLKQDRAYRQKPEVMSRKKEYMKAYQQTPEVMSRKKEYRQTPEYKAYQKAYHQTPDYKVYKSAHKANSTARKLNKKGRIKKMEWWALLEKYNHTCLCCGTNGEQMTLDHVIPMKKGGDNLISNAQPLCFNCNNIKRQKSTDYRNGRIAKEAMKKAAEKKATEGGAMMGRYKAFGNIGNYRLSAKQARKLGRQWMAQVNVSVEYMSDEDKAAMGIANGVVMAKQIVHRGEVIATNFPLRGVPEPKRKPA